MNNTSIKSQKTLNIWSFIGLGFVILNFVLALSFYESRKEIVRILFFIASGIHFIGCISAWIRVYPLARICWIIGGILNFPLGLIMFIGANKAKELSAKQEGS